MSDWTKIKRICQSHDNKKDCQGCGYNTVKDGVKWQLDARIPCANAINNQAKIVEVK